MMMKTCICIAGMPASGKTTAALRLSEKLGIAMLSKDEIKEKLFDRIGFQSRQEKVQLGLAAMEILYYAAERCLAAGESVILENNFEDLSRPGLQALQERTGCRMITILFDGETRAVYERFVKRDQSPTRHLSLIHICTGLVVLSIAAVVFILALTGNWGGKSQLVEVPPLINLTVEQAASTLSDAGLELNRAEISYALTDDVEKDVYKRQVLKGKDLDQMKTALAQVLQEYRRQRSQAHLSIDVNPLILE